jgi:hypothetical protein
MLWGLFVINLGVKAMKDTDLLADAMTRSVQKATNALKQKLRAEGCRATDPRMYEVRTRNARQYIADHPEIFEQALVEVTAWRRAKITSDTQRKRR